MSPEDSQTKAETFVALVDNLLGAPVADHLLGRCKECRTVVWICTSIRPAGMAESCEEHEPLCCLEAE
jgi:hypothetical protein